MTAKPLRARGGHARAKSMTEMERRASATKAATARWARTAKARALKKVAARPGALVARVYDLLSAAVEEGTAYGMRTADKHTEDPLTEAQRERVAHHVEMAVLGAIMDRFDIKEEPRDA